MVKLEFNQDALASLKPVQRVSKIIFWRIIQDIYYVLLVKSPKYWTLPGGKSEGNESPLETALRELREELDLDIDVQLIDAYNLNDKVRLFGSRFETDDVVPRVKGETLNIRWVALDKKSISRLTDNFWNDEKIMNGIRACQNRMLSLLPIKPRYICSDDDFVFRCDVCHYSMLKTNVCILCPHCGEISDPESYQWTCNVCGDKFKMDYKDECCPTCVVPVDDDQYEYESNDDELDDPCSDCDDSKIPFSARSCEDCYHHHGFIDLPLTPQEFDALNDEDSSAYEFDMYGPNAARKCLSVNVIKGSDPEFECLHCNVKTLYIENPSGRIFCAKCGHSNEEFNPGIAQFVKDNLSTSALIKQRMNICDMCGHFSGNATEPGVRPAHCNLDGHEVSEKDTCQRFQ